MFHLRKLSHLSVHSSTSQKALLTIGKGLCIPDISASVNTTSGDSIDIKAGIKKKKTNLVHHVEPVRHEWLFTETVDGNLQIPLPGRRAPLVFAIRESAQHPTAAVKKTSRKKKAAPTPELPVDVGRFDLRVGKIIDIQKHPTASSLYLEKIDCGDTQPRNVISGLVNHVSIDEMRDRLVVVLCNLKPNKIRGITSEAMVMCASTADKVEVLAPPVGAIPGDLVHCDGYTRQPDNVLNSKKKIFDAVIVDLLTNDQLEVCYKGAVLNVPGKGNIVAHSLKNAYVK